MRNPNRLVLAAAIATFCAGTYAPAQDEVGVTTELERGEAVFTYWCAACHSAGPGMPGTQALEAKYDGSRPAVLTERADLTHEQIAFFVRNGVSVMPPFRKTEVSDADLDALSTYIVNTAHRD